MKSIIKKVYLGLSRPINSMPLWFRLGSFFALGVLAIIDLRYGYIFFPEKRSHKAQNLIEAAMPYSQASINIQECGDLIQKAISRSNFEDILKEGSSKQQQALALYGYCFDLVERCDKGSQAIKDRQTNYEAHRSLQNMRLLLSEIQYSKYIDICLDYNRNKSLVALEKEVLKLISEYDSLNNSLSDSINALNSGKSFESYIALQTAHDNMERFLLENKLPLSDLSYVAEFLAKHQYLSPDFAISGADTRESQAKPTSTPQQVATTTVPDAPKHDEEPLSNQPESVAVESIPSPRSLPGTSDSQVAAIEIVPHESKARDAAPPVSLEHDKGPMAEQDRVASDTLTEQKEERIRVSKPTRITETPNRYGQALKQLKAGEYVTAMKADRVGWFFVTFEGTQGYIHSDFLEVKK